MTSIYAFDYLVWSFFSARSYTFPFLESGTVYDVIGLGEILFLLLLLLSRKVFRWTRKFLQSRYSIGEEYPYLYLQWGGVEIYLRSRCLSVFVFQGGMYFTSNIVQIWYLTLLNKFAHTKFPILLRLMRMVGNIWISPQFLFSLKLWIWIANPEPLDTLCKSIDFSVSPSVNPSTIYLKFKHHIPFYSKLNSDACSY